MSDTMSDLLGRWHDWPAALARLLADCPRPADRARGLAGLLRRLVPPTVGAGCRLSGAEHAEGERGEGPHRLTAAAGGAGEFWLVLPPSADEATRTALRALLGLAAQALALHLEVEGLREEEREGAPLVTVGEAMIGLTHSFNNSLNTMVLQTATLQMRAPPELHADLAVVRREGAQAAARLRPLQALRSRRAPSADADLNAAVSAALAPPSDLAGRVVVEAGPDLPPLPVHPATLRRLVRLLVRVALPCHRAADRPLRVRTARAGESTELLVEADGEGGAAAPQGLSDLPVEAGGPMEELERIAVESMVKRLDGRLELRARPDGGLTCCVAWAGEAGAP
jgi:hypothetical protein